MTTKLTAPKPKTPPAKTSKRTKQTKQTKQTKHTETDQEKSIQYAKVSLSASYMNAILGDRFYKPLFPDATINDVASLLKDKIATVLAGDMTSIEAMLIGQAQALQTMFVCLGRQAVSKTQLPQYTAFMNLALKAQSQSRATIQALVELKYPKQTNFVKQANIANGHQQINNNAPAPSTKETNTRAPAHAPAKEINNQPNELLEVNNGSQNMDGRTTQTTIPNDKKLAAVAAQHRG